MNQTIKNTKRVGALLGISRAEKELVEITKQAEKLGVRIVPLALFSYAPVKFSITSLELSEIDWLCFTSSRGVEGFFDSLKSKGQSVASRTKFAVVGKKTAASLISYGFAVELQPRIPISEALFAELKGLLESVEEGQRVVYVGAEEVRFDPTGSFESGKLDFSRLVVYRAEQALLDEGIVQQFSEFDSILFTSPKSAERFDELFGTPVAKVIAMGSITRDSIEGLGWGSPEVLAEPDSQLALAVCKSHFIESNKKAICNE